LIENLRARFALAPDAEVTLEVNPRDLDIEGYRRLRTTGVNRKYWNDSPFLGFGQSAHSYGGGRRWWNADTYGGYCRAIEDRGTAVVGERVATPRERAGEALFTGLRRRHGVDLAAFRARYGVDPLADYG